MQAVRGINFDLEEGETLAVVGESGSGKSVTSKAILGILAGNSIIEDGEIIYDSKDLLKISEEDFHKIRGDKIAMIFQDPLSSLNPIMRIGKQLTEAMLLKGKARQKACRRDFNTMLRLLRLAMTEAVGNDAARSARIAELCRMFDKFEFKHIELEQAYNRAKESAKEAISEIDDALFLIEKDAFSDAKSRIGEIAGLAKRAINDYVVSGADAERLSSLAGGMLLDRNGAVKEKQFGAICGYMSEIKTILSESIEKPEPNFFCMGYYLTFSGEPLPELPVEELNPYLRKYIDDNFMLEFKDLIRAALLYSAERGYEQKSLAREELSRAIPALSEGELDKKAVDELVKSLIRSVNASIDRININKDSTLYTFESAIRHAVSVYFGGVSKNAKEERRYARQKAKYDAICEKSGKAPDWKVAPAAVVDLALARANIVRIVTRVIERYDLILAARAERDFDAEAVGIIDYLKLNASGVVNRVTRRMAKMRALKLMEEVGIPEPRKRYKQYPFEFSGGMRQRIVIAIALAANPDVLICDEPTTALDVTIQAQILELINKLKRERNLSIIFITHDLGVVANMADKIAVMYAGKIVEYGTAREVFYEPAHPYTWALLSSMPDLDTDDKLEAIPGTPPNMIYPPVGDAFADRNKYAMKIDFEEQPPMFKITETHSAATWLLHPDAPKISTPKIITDRIERMRKMRGEDSNG